MNLGVAILAAGKGKRMQNPDLPKVLTPLNGKPLLAYVIETALKLSPTKIYIIVGYKKQLVIDFCKKEFNQKEIEFVEQTEQLGTGHAVLQIEPFIDLSVTDLLVLSGDVPLISFNNLNNLITFHQENGNDLSLISTKIKNPFGYGRIIRNSNGRLCKIIEHKDLLDKNVNLNEINAGIYLIKIDNLFENLKLLSNDNAQEEYYLTDLIEIYLKKGLKVDALMIDDFTEVLGVNTYEELNEISSILSTKIG